MSLVKRSGKQLIKNLTNIDKCYIILIGDIYDKYKTSQKDIGSPF